MSTESSTRFVWLPSSRVWAYVPSSSQAPVEMEDRAKRKRRSVATIEGSISSQAAGIGELGLAPGFTSLSQQQREKQSRLGLESSSSQQATCAICLGAIEREKGAVLRFCMHEFCTHCIEEWSRVRRVCPLCKADFSGWYQGTRLEERILPPATLGQQQSLPRSSTPVHSSSRLPFWRLHSQRDQGRGRWRQPFQDRTQSHSHSVQSRVQAMGRLVPFPTQRTFHVNSRTKDARIVEEESAARAMRWRASIYEQGLKACPFEIRRRPSSFQALHDPDTKVRAERRLEPWICRELQVLLRDQDPSLLVHFVLALWFKCEGRSSSSLQQRLPSVKRNEFDDQAREGDKEAVKELEQFLGDRAYLFWHELRNFAESPFTMKAYDTTVIYAKDNQGSGTKNHNFRNLRQKNKA
ncbi:unnamed protein product [Sphagnum tenellum]